MSQVWKAAADKVIVQKTEPAKQTASGLVLPDKIKGGKVSTGTVIAVTHDHRMIQGFDSTYHLEDGRLARVDRADPS